MNHSLNILIFSMISSHLCTSQYCVANLVTPNKILSMMAHLQSLPGSDPLPFHPAHLKNDCSDVGNFAASSSCSLCVGTWLPALSSALNLSTSGDGLYAIPKAAVPALSWRGRNQKVLQSLFLLIAYLELVMNQEAKHRQRSCSFFFTHSFPLKFNILSTSRITSLFLSGDFVITTSFA